MGYYWAAFYTPVILTAMQADLVANYWANWSMSTLALLGHQTSEEANSGPEWEIVATADSNVIHIRRVFETPTNSKADLVDQGPPSNKILTFPVNQR